MYEPGSLFIPADTYTQIRMCGCYLQLHAARTSIRWQHLVKNTNCFDDNSLISDYIFLKAA